MLHSSVLAAAFLLALNADSAFAEDIAQDDAKILDEAFSNIREGKFDDAVKKADLIINRFEAGKDPASNYMCASGGSDTLMNLLGVAIAAQKEAAKDDSGKSVTATISTTICDAYFARGFALVDLGQREQALPNFEMATKLDPDNQHYLNELAEWYKAGRQWQKSLELFTLASETTDFSVEAMDDKKQSKRILNDMRCRSYRGIAFNHVELKQWDNARTALKKCLKLIPGEPNSKAEMTYIEEHAGK